MIEPSTLALFLLASLTLLVMPGPATVYIMTRSIEQGYRAGLASVLGISAGMIVHFIAAALGISAILMTSATAFSIVKYLGAAYLIYLGIQKLRSDETLTAQPTRVERSLVTIFRQGIIVNVLNPKAAIFAFAFLPQFIDPARGPAWAQIMLLGLIFVSLAFFTDGSYALLAGRVRHWLSRNRTFLRRQKYVTGGTYIALGVATATAGPEGSS